MTKHVISRRKQKDAWHQKYFEIHQKLELHILDVLWKNRKNLSCVLNKDENVGVDPVKGKTDNTGGKPPDCKKGFVSKSHAVECEGCKKGFT